MARRARPTSLTQKVLLDLGRQADLRDTVFDSSIKFPNKSCLKGAFFKGMGWDPRPDSWENTLYRKVKRAAKDAYADVLRKASPAARLRISEKSIIDENYQAIHQELERSQDPDVVACCKNEVFRDHITFHARREYVHSKELLLQQERDKSLTPQDLESASPSVSPHGAGSRKRGASQLDRRDDLPCPKRREVATGSARERAHQALTGLSPLGRPSADNFPLGKGLPLDLDSTCNLYGLPGDANVVAEVNKYNVIDVNFVDGDTLDGTITANGISALAPNGTYIPNELPEPCLLYEHTFSARPTTDYIGDAQIHMASEQPIPTDIFGYIQRLSTPALNTKPVPNTWLPSNTNQSNLDGWPIIGIDHAIRSNSTRLEHSTFETLLQPQPRGMYDNMETYGSGRAELQSFILPAVAPSNPHPTPLLGNPQWTSGDPLRQDNGYTAYRDDDAVPTCRQASNNINNSNYHMSGGFRVESYLDLSISRVEDWLSETKRSPSPPHLLPPLPHLYTTTTTYQQESPLLGQHPQYDQSELIPNNNNQPDTDTLTEILN